jgi:hypothetical protein
VPLIVPAGFAHVIHSYSLAGDNERLSYTYGVALGDMPPDGLNGVAEQLHGLTAQVLWDLPQNVYALESTEVQGAGSVGNPGPVGVFVQRIPGTGTSAHLPQNSSTLIHKRSGAGGRRNRGRLNFIPPAEASVSANGAIDPASVSGFQTRFSSWLQQIQALTAVADMVILHSVGISTAPPPTVVTSLVVDPVISTQRKRLR